MVTMFVKNILHFCFTLAQFGIVISKALKFMTLPILGAYWQGLYTKRQIKLMHGHEVHEALYQFRECSAPWAGPLWPHGKQFLNL